jgi:transposase
LVLLLSNAQHHTIAQFRNRQDAEDHLRTIQRLARNSRFALLFVPPYDPDPSEP